MLAVIIIFSKDDFLVKRGDRIAQVVCEEFRSTEAVGSQSEHGITLPGNRNENGYGSSDCSTENAEREMNGMNCNTVKR